MIDVRQTGHDDPLSFEVRVTAGGGETRHDVTLSRRDAERLGGGVAPDRLIDAAFRFLLDREPKESILRRFDVSVISRYFPEFDARLADYLS
ncbi:MAG: hypothetical protein CMD39_03270 [Gammaproteobacteria bacterium]|nr:hypothetical protein [Gammaproteobacteria bacterium]